LRVERAFLRSRIARRIVALFVLSALVPIMAMAVLAFDRVHDLLVDQGHAELAQLSESYISTVYERMLAVDRETRSIAAIHQPRTEWSPQLQQRLREQFGAVAVVSADGDAHVLLGDLREFPDYPAGSTRHLATGEPVVVTRPRGAARADVFLLRPMNGNHPEGDRLVVQLNPDYLWGEAGTFPAFTDFCTIDDSGQIMFCTQPSVPARIRAFASSPRESASGRFSFVNDGEDELANYRELFMAPRFFVHGWTTVAMRPEAVTLAASAAFRRVFIPVVALAILVVALLSVSQVRRTLVPLERLIEGTRRAGNRDFAVRVDVRGNDEFGELAASFNSMAARLGSQFTALMTLADIDRAILSRLDVDRVLETVATRMREIVPADCISIGVLDRNASAIMRLYTRDQRVEGSLSIERAPCSDADARELLAHPDGRWLGPYTAERPFTAPVRRLGARSVFVLPIIWQEAAIGVVVLGYATETQLSEDDRARARDIGDRVGVAFATAAKDEQLYYQAHYDALTQLPNRLYFKDQLARRLSQAQRERKRFALLFIDLDHFKNVNDSFGHAEGDEVLRQAALRLGQCVREADSVARLGGDEFTVILPEIRTGRDAELVADNVIQAMCAPFVVGARAHFLNASIGIALYPADGTTADDLLRNADTAMYRAKDSGRGRAVYFEERMNAAAQARVLFERDMRAAIEHRQFVLVYQPQLALPSGSIAGAEALVRWDHPERGLLSPLNFIQLAEETGLIGPLGEWVLREACEQFMRWVAEGTPIPRIAVNVSARQFADSGFLAMVCGILEATGMPARALEIEITESLLMDATLQVELTLGKLSALGIRIALDDFGTGYSSLAYLKRFPVDTVKIDRSFIKDLPGDESSGAITAAIVAMAHALNKEVVAEGVAAAEQLEMLRRLRCDVVQGYHVSRPVCANDLSAFLRTIDGGSAQPVPRAA
jgi:diguanylate cyclase (GGDEF)-like protein